ncbi:MAG TPA: branched-chain amino acid ABC transporter permease [Actinomycetota bacterium]|nr:branched-chain amino acid ABC transporter permease [Actinomycetota bacterium]
MSKTARRKGTTRRKPAKRKPAKRKPSRSRAARTQEISQEEIERELHDQEVAPSDQRDVRIKRGGEVLPTDQAPADAAESLGTVKEPVPRAEGFRPSPLGWVARGIVMAAVGALVLGFPASQPAADVTLFTKAITYAIIGLSLNVLIGYTGQISLGHQAFVGIGAFTSAYMVSQSEQPFLIAVVIAMFVGGAQAAVLGLVSLRVRGLYFALVTLSYGLFAEKTLFKIETLTGGAAGQNAPRPGGFESEHRYFYLCVAVLAVVLWIDARLMKSKGGRALLALRENPRVASTFGVNVTMYTLFAFVLSGVFAGLGGALLAHNNTQVSSVGFDFQLALIFVIMTVVGGLKSRPGIVIGSALFALTGYLIENIPGVESALRNIPGLPELTPGAAALVLGPLLLLLTLTVFPGGIGQQIRPITQWLIGKRFDPKDRGLREVLVTDVRA